MFEFKSTLIEKLTYFEIATKVKRSFKDSS